MRTRQIIVQQIHENYKICPHVLAPTNSRPHLNFLTSDTLNVCDICAQPGRLQEWSYSDVEQCPLCKAVKRKDDKGGW